MGGGSEGSSGARLDTDRGKGSHGRGVGPSAAAPRPAPADPIDEFVARMQGIEAALAPAVADTSDSLIADIAYVLADALSNAVQRKALARMRSRALNGEQLDRMTAALVHVHAPIGELREKLTTREG